MEPEGSLPHSEEPATCPCPEFSIKTHDTNVSASFFVMPTLKMVTGSQCHQSNSSGTAHMCGLVKNVS
jgi:hypothetical protein